MNYECLTPHILEYIRQRALGNSAFEVSSKPELRLSDKQMVICYGDQSNNYCFDYYNDEDEPYGIEGFIGFDKFSVVRYTDITYSDTWIEISLTDLPYGITEEEYFMQSTIQDFHNLTYEQITAILAIREVLVGKIPNWSVKA